MAENDARDLGRRFAAARHDASVSAAELGDVLGIDAAGIAAVERGDRHLDGVELALAAEHLGVGVRHLLGLPPRAQIKAVLVCGRR